MKTQLAFALLIAGAIAAWMWSGNIIVAGSAQEAERRPPAERSQAAATLFRVKTEVSQAVERPRSLTMRGRTRADALVRVAAETAGRVVARPVDRGDHIAEGDVLCQIDPGVREALLARAHAEREKATLEFDAATKLRGRGFESDTRVASTKAALDAANADVAAAQQELERATVKAPLSGTVEEPIVDKGTMLQVGDVCATIVDADPMIVTGQVAERDMPLVRYGVTSTVQLITGETVEGTVGFISRTADPDTRTFKVEIDIANPDDALRAGVTARAEIPLPPVTVHRLSPGVLTLGKDGEIGVRTVNADGVVAFEPVRIAMHDTEGFWVTGLADEVTIITVGQDYVTEGQTVLFETDKTAVEG